MAKSINTIPVKMSITIGKAAGITHEANAAKYGRAKIVEIARRMGLTTPLNDTVSLPIGAAEVYVIDQAAGYAVFANGGKRATPYAAFEVRNSKGDVIYRRDRDGPEPEQVLSSRVVADMNFMLAKVNEEGTGKRAALEGIRSGGKTGTTNDYHDAWYIGFTGNLVAAVWYGNDDYSSTEKMTGGTLPAMTWHDMMSFAHQNFEIKPIPGLEQPQGAPAQAKKGGGPGGIVEVNATSAAPGALSRRSFEVIGGLGDLFHTVERPAVARTGFYEPAQAANVGSSAIKPSGARIALP